MDQQKIIKIQMMEQEVNQMNQQLQLIDQNIEEMHELVASLEEVETGKQIMANLGKRLYVPVEIKDDKLIVEVGKGNFVKKNIDDTKKIIERETGKLTEGKSQIMERLNVLQTEMNEIIMEIQKEQVEAQAGENKADKKEESIEDLAG